MKILIEEFHWSTALSVWRRSGKEVKGLKSIRWIRSEWLFFHVEWVDRECRVRDTKCRIKDLPWQCWQSGLQLLQLSRLPTFWTLTVTFILLELYNRCQENFLEETCFYVRLTSVILLYSDYFSFSFQSSRNSHVLACFDEWQGSAGTHRVQLLETPLLMCSISVPEKKMKSLSNYCNFWTIENKWSI